MTQISKKAALTSGQFEIRRELSAKWRPATGASLLIISAAAGVQPAFAQVAQCPSAVADSDQAPSGGQSAAARLRNPDPLVRDMARADQLYDSGARDQAEQIYIRLSQARPDRRQTANRAKLKLAQSAISRSDYARAEALVTEATGQGTLPDLQARGQRLRAQIGERRQMGAAEAALEAVDGLVTSQRFDEAVLQTQSLLRRPCPYPDDYPARVKIRLAQVYRAKGDFASAQATAADAVASAATPRVRDRANEVAVEIGNAARRNAQLDIVTQADARLAAGDANGAIAVLQPLVASQQMDPQVEPSARLRLARAYSRAERHGEAIAVLEPLVAPGTPMSATLEPADYESIGRIYLARGSQLQASGSLAESAAVYQQVLSWNPPVAPEVRDSARLSLARVLDRQGDKAGALAQIELVRTGNPNPQTLQRANNLLADIQDGAPLNRPYGYVQAGVAYDSNAPTRIAAVNDADEDVPFPVNQRFDDIHVNLAGRLQYRHQFGQSADYLDIDTYAQRTLQFDLPQLDRTRLGVRAGPVFALPGGATQLRFGGQFDIEWRGDRFRSSEAGGYVGIRHELTNTLSAAATYSLAWHNDVRPERDALHHSLDLEFRAKLSDADVLTFDFRVQREGGKIERVRNWGLRGGANFRHRFHTEAAFVPFVEAGVEAERLIFDGAETNGQMRRDWKYSLEGAVGADIARNWRVWLHYSYFDIDSNVATRDRLGNHQAGVNLRYSWN